MSGGAGGPSFTSACGKVPVIDLGIPARWKVSWEWGSEETGTRWQTGTTPHTARIRLCLYALWVAGIHSLPGSAVRLPSVNCHRAGLKRCVRALSVQVFAVCCLCSKSWVGLGVGQILDAQTREWRLRPRDTMRVACTACRRTAGNPPKLLERLHSCKHSRPCTGRCSSCPELTSMCEVAAVCPGLHWRSKARQAGCQGIAWQRAVKTRWRGAPWCALSHALRVGLPHSQEVLHLCTSRQSAAPHQRSSVLVQQALGVVHSQHTREGTLAVATVAAADVAGGKWR